MLESISFATSNFRTDQTKKKKNKTNYNFSMKQECQNYFRNNKVKNKIHETREHVPTTYKSNLKYVSLRQLMSAGRQDKKALTLVKLYTSLVNLNSFHVKKKKTPTFYPQYIQMVMLSTLIYLYMLQNYSCFLY